jgi:5-methylcytosine-specific restriction endonuclease McrA
MRFELEVNRRNVPDKTLLDDVAHVAQRLGTKSITIEHYREYGQFDPSTIIKRFNGWRNALLRANLEIKHHNAGVDRDQALADLRRVAGSLGLATVSQQQYLKSGRFSTKPFIRMFGTWNNALREVGLEPSKNYRVSDESLFENLAAIWRTLGRQPRYTEVEKPFSKFSAGTYEIRFGGWRKALEAFVEYANEYKAPSNNSTDESVESGARSVTPIVRRRRRTPRVPGWRLRFLVMKRDGFRCRACGASPATTPGVCLHVDHIRAWSEFGETVLENLQTLCEVCNIGKNTDTAEPA